MIGNEAALGVIYSGEALYCQRKIPIWSYVIPKEGSNLWIDALVIPKNAQTKRTQRRLSTTSAVLILQK